MQPPGLNENQFQIGPEIAENRPNIDPETIHNRPRIDPRPLGNLWGSPLGIPPEGSPRRTPPGTPNRNRHETITTKKGYQTRFPP